MMLRAIIALAVTFAAPSSIFAQTCGWDAIDIAPDGLPHSITQLASRAPNPAALIEPLDQIRSWVHSCDDGAMRRAIFELRRDADRQCTSVYQTSGSRTVGYKRNLRMSDRRN